MKVRDVDGGQFSLLVDKKLTSGVDVSRKTISSLNVVERAALTASKGIRSTQRYHVATLIKVSACQSAGFLLCSCFANVYLAVLSS